MCTSSCRYRLFYFARSSVCQPSMPVLGGLPVAQPACACIVSIEANHHVAAWLLIVLSRCSTSVDMLLGAWGNADISKTSQDGKVVGFSAGGYQ